jgi:integrase
MGEKLFRDGHTIEQPENISPEARAVAIKELFNYLYGSESNQTKHYLIWFKLTNNDDEFTVQFDRDGDAYIDTPDGDCIMTEFKIRSAQLVYRREEDKCDGSIIFIIGFGGINTCGIVDGKCISINNVGDWESIAEITDSCVMMKI